MKTLSYFKYFFLVVFAATLMFSCSDDDSSDDLLNSKSDTIQLRSGDEDPGGDGDDTDIDCFVEVCVTMIPTDESTFEDIFIVALPSIGSVTITNGIALLPDGTTEPLVDNQFCTMIPITGSATAVLTFKGFGGVLVTGEWTNGAVCELFTAQGDPSLPEPTKAKQSITLSCESPCPPPPDCFIEVCVTFNPADNNDVFSVQYPTIGTLVITNGIVLLPDGTTEPLVGNEFCADIPIFGPISAFVSFFGEGSAVVNATYENGQVCEVFQAGLDTDTYSHICQDVELSCEPACPPPPDCFIEVCATITPGGVNDIYIVGLPNVGNVVIQNNTVTLPNGDQLPLIDNQFCTMIPIFGSASADLSFFGTGAVEVTAEWPDQTICPIFDAGVGTDEDVHVCENITLTCDPTCPPPPLCEVTICAEFNAGSATDIYIVQLPNVGNITITNGTVTLPSGMQMPLPADNIFCATIPLFAASTAELIFKGTGSVVTTGTWPDGSSCEIFSAGVGTTSPVKVKQPVTLSCESPCPQTCEIEICATLIPNPDSSFEDSYVVTLPDGGQVIVQSGIVTLPDGTQLPLINNQFCATIEIEEGTTETAVLSFVGAGQVVTTIEYEDGGSCVVFKAGTTNTKVVKVTKEVTLGCDPIC